MTHTYSVTGMSCSGCQATVQKLLSQIPGIKNVSVDLQKAEATIEMEKHISTSEMQSALKDHSKYQLNEKKNSPNGHTPAPPQVKPADLNRLVKESGGKYYCPMHCEGDKTY
ncbi:MAG: heavy metal-associated domain-containing protein, partial [Ginsengibacter sp.]